MQTAAAMEFSIYQRALSMLPPPPIAVAAGASSSRSSTISMMNNDYRLLEERHRFVHQKLEAVLLENMALKTISQQHQEDHHLSKLQIQELEQDSSRLVEERDYLQHQNQVLQEQHEQHKKVIQTLKTEKEQLKLVVLTGKKKLLEQSARAPAANTAVSCLMRRRTSSSSSSSTTSRTMKQAQQQQSMAMAAARKRTRRTREAAQNLADDLLSLANKNNISNNTVKTVNKTSIPKTERQHRIDMLLLNNKSMATNTTNRNLLRELLQLHNSKRSQQPQVQLALRSATDALRYTTKNNNHMEDDDASQQQKVPNDALSITSSASSSNTSITDDKHHTESPPPPKTTKGVPPGGVRCGGHDVLWNKTFLKLKTYQAHHGHTAVTRREDPTLHAWCTKQRLERCRDDNLKRKHRINLLNSIGFNWQQRHRSHGPCPSQTLTHHAAHAHAAIAKHCFSPLRNQLNKDIHREVVVKKRTERKSSEGGQVRKYNHNGGW